jgi:galactokinase
MSSLMKGARRAVSFRPMSAATQSAAASAAGARALFLARFGREPDVVASAPGRVNLIGEHTDYNGGEVLPIAIARRTWVAAAFRHGDVAATLRAVSATEPGVSEASLEHATRSGEWWDYLLGVASPLLREGGDRMPSLDAAVTSDVPAGAGLSSSAALEVASALAVSSLRGAPLPLREAAMLGWRAETGFVGVQSGIMDQFASALGEEGQALHIDCETTETSLAPFGETVLIFDTAVRRSLRDSAFNTRRAECAEALRLLRLRWPSLPSLARAEPEQVLEAGLPDPLNKRALHVSRETRRVREAVALLCAGLPLTRELLVGSHESLRDLYECSRPELDWIVDRAVRMEGVRGARLTGAGWGGCAIVVGDERALAAAGPVLAREYEARFRLVPRLWLSGAAAGARVERGAR